MRLKNQFIYGLLEINQVLFIAVRGEVIEVKIKTALVETSVSIALLNEVA